MQESKEQLKERLGDKAYEITQNAGTEAPFSGEYVDLFDDGKYHCKVCSAILFSSESKASSRVGSAGLQGWPNFKDALPGAIKTRPDNSYAMQRTEILCANCNSHLGHLFEEKEGKHYCVNSCALDFKEEIDKK